SARASGASSKWCSTAAASCITAASRAWPKPRARRDCSSKGENMPRIDPNTPELEERVVKTNKVQKTHKGGRTLSWNALVVVGDNRGHVGVALGKARGIPDAIRKGVEAAKKSIIRVELDGTTIPHKIVSDWGAAKVMLKPAS